MMILALCGVGAAPGSEDTDGSPGETQPKPRPVGFARDIRPLLSENCFACHGPDEKARKAGLRLDTQEGAFAELKGGGRAIVPGKPDDSELIDRIESDDPERVMPPKKSGKQLSADQVATIRRWVEQGASWTRHWAFKPAQKPELPAVKDGRWPANPIDRFILARLEAEGLAPEPEADKTALIRRVTLDLTGLPPTLPEVDAFLKDRSESAYETVVNRLLDSPRYGEHQARFWLDAARYGDTHGLHLDNYREIWPYRDWVIRAFNANMPFDQFVVEQLAGDLLPNATLDQVVATGFNRCQISTSEGGSIEEEVYVRNIVDQVDTNGTVFMGLFNRLRGATTTSSTRSGRRIIISSSRSSTTSTVPRSTVTRRSGSRSSRCRRPPSARRSRPWTARSPRSASRSPPRPPARRPPTTLGPTPRPAPRSVAPTSPGSTTPCRRVPRPKAVPGNSSASPAIPCRAADFPSDSPPGGSIKS